MKKKILISIAVLLAALFMAVPTFAVDKLYILRDNTNAYENASSDSKVLKKYKAGETILVDHYASGNANWVSTLIEDKKNGGQILAWLHMSNLSFSMPPSACKHKWSEWQVTTQPTCTSGGMQTRSCSICGSIEGVDIPMLGHNFSDWRTTEEATCTSTGEKQRTCSRCGKVEYQTIERKAHTYTDWKVTQEATCTRTGERVRTCKVCRHEEVQTLDKLPHSYGDWTVIKDSTCAAEGSRKHTCRVCGHESTEAIAKKPHDFEWKIIREATDHSAGIRSSVCKNCGYTEEEVSYDPEGTLRRGDRSEEVRTMQQLLADQNYLNADGADGIFGGGTEKAVTQFQNDRGITADGVCWPQTLKLLQHEFGPWEVIKPLTRTEAGECVRTCKDCGFEQHVEIPLSPCFERGRRGEDVRAVQQMITSLGYDAGNYDGIYGQKLDNAFDGYTKANNLTFKAGIITPDLLDSLTNSWIASLPDDQWNGESHVDSPVNPALTITKKSDETNGTTLSEYSWSLTNLGDESCIFAALLLNFGEKPDFTKDNTAVVIDGVELEPNCGNSVSGSFMADSAWGTGDMNFCALVVSEETGAVWLSNITGADELLAE